MAIPPPRNGAVIRYAYLWREEKECGLIEARKDRPAAVVLAHKDGHSAATAGISCGSASPIASSGLLG